MYSTHASTLSCGHTAKMPCCTDYKKLQCKEQVSMNFPECNHTVQVECYRKGYKACPEPCLLPLQCGHQSTKTCHMDDDPDHIKYMCPKPCSRPVPKCTTDGHQCPLPCFEKCKPCAATVVKTLLCGHTMTVPCIQTEFICEMPCNLTLPCGHPRERLCADDCGGCNVKVEKVVPLCGHKVKIECGKTPTKECCEGQCRVRLRCGHKCAKRCKETCSEQDCVELTQLQLSLPCGHSGALVPCNMVNKILSAGIDSVERERLLQYCMEPCLQMLKCDHRCSGTCGQCMQGRIHKVCDEDCNNTLICGHRKYQCKEQVSINFPECNHTVQVECYRKGYKACPEPCLLRLECGHQCTKTCHMDDDPDHIKYMCPKPCSRPVPKCTTDGHQCPLPCFEKCKPCAATVVKTLLCGHTMTVPCIQTEFICEMPCNLTLPCGHPCERLCADDCGGCNVKVEKVVPLCGHKVKIECGKTPTKECCEGQCRVRLRCGHKCAKRCKETCSEQDCVELTQLQLSLPCGHSGALVPCNMVNKILSADIDSVEREGLLQYCMEPCLQMLKCDHRCSGTCGQCMQGRIHKVCDEDCNNTLICGHSCPVPCCKVCPPCQKKCQARCVHTKCPKRCGEPCTPCNEPCEYRCVHSQCKKRCGELCNRKPCTHPCLLLLACSHPCVGFCGEPCPPCKECHPEHFEPFAYTGEEDEPETKWVLLNDCKHVVDAPNMERWLQMEQEGGAEIKLMTCPKCTPTAPNRHIYTTQRYMNMIKSTFTDIEMVKKKLFGIVDDIRSERSKLLNQVKDIPSKTLEELSDNEEIYRLYLHLHKVLPTINKNRRKDVGFEQLKVLKFMVSYLTDMVQRRYEIWGKLSDKEKKKYTAKVDILTKALRERDQKISREEVESFSREQKRIVRFGDLLMLENSDEFQPLKSKSDVVKNLETAKTLVNQFSEYSDTLDTKVFDAIQKLKEAIKSNAQISDKDRRMIHMAMSKDFYGGSQSQGHWFKCPNGHTYCITEKGTPMLEAVCPEKGCKARIGGQCSRFLPGQRLALEMYGATRPEWLS